jgi:hypothetical protein
MVVLRPGNHVELLDHGATEPVLREHPADGFLHDERRPLLEEILVQGAGDAAWMPRVAPGHLLGLLAAREHHLRSIDDDQIVADVHVRGEDRLVLAAEDHRSLRSNPAKHLLAGVDDVPAAFDVLRLGRVGLHRKDVGPRGRRPMLPAETRPRQSVGRFPRPRYGSSRSRRRRRVGRTARSRSRPAASFDLITSASEATGTSTPRTLMDTTSRRRSS